MDILGSLRSMLADSHDNSLSSKRVVTFLAFTMCAIGFLSDMIWKMSVTQGIYDSMMGIVMVGLGTTVAEKFAKKDS